MSVTPHSRALCKFRGMLVIMEYPFQTAGTCLDCGGKTLTQHDCWYYCDCGFAVSDTDHNRIIKQQQQQ